MLFMYVCMDGWSIAQQNFGDMSANDEQLPGCNNAVQCDAMRRFVCFSCHRDFRL